MGISDTILPLCESKIIINGVLFGDKHMINTYIYGCTEFAGIYILDAICQIAWESGEEKFLNTIDEFSKLLVDTAKHFLDKKREEGKI